MEQGSKTTKQVELEVELRKKSPSEVVEDTQETLEIVVEEPAVEQVTPELVLRRSSSTIGVLDMYVSSLHYLLLMKGNHEPFDEALQLEDTTKWKQAMDDGMSGLKKCVVLKLSTWQ